MGKWQLRFTRARSPGLLKRHPSRLRRAPAIYRPGSRDARFRCAGEGWVFGSGENIVFLEPSPAAGPVSR
jgi:hypothetical protein